MEQQNNEKLSDRAFSHLALTSVLGILVCIICLSATTYAWFTSSVQGDNNKIQTADTCLLSVSVYKDGANKAVIDTHNPITLECEGTYTVTLTLPKGSASGYLVITVGTQEYYSDYLQRNDNTDGTLTFTLNVQTAQSITFTACWGICSRDCNVPDNKTLNIS